MAVKAAMFYVICDGERCPKVKIHNHGSNLGISESNEQTAPVYAGISSCKQKKLFIRIIKKLL